ncbi:MAG: hypothetical protein IBJ14_11395 [Hydrogenophaga sp.]|nr:hypothetical protein [Hydrogenophaga sp.]
MSWPFLHHPAFQSLLLPALLCLLCTGALRWWLGPAHRPWTPLGASLGLALAMLWWPGLVWPAATQAQKLPWIVLFGLLAAAGAQRPARATAPSPRRPWLLATIAWAASAAWLLGLAAPLPLLTAVAGGAAVLAASAWSTRAPNAEPTAAAGSAAALALVLLGLAVLAVAAGSLLLAQLALMTTLATAVLGLWAWWWPRSGPRVTATSLMPLGIAALALATLNLATGRVHAGALGLLAVSLTAPWWAASARWTGRFWRWRPAVVALLAALPVAVALGWQLAAPTEAPTGDADDPYYTPRW